MAPKRKGGGGPSVLAQLPELYRNFALESRSIQELLSMVQDLRIEVPACVTPTSGPKLSPFAFDAGSYLYSVAVTLSSCRMCNGPKLFSTSSMRHMLPVNACPRCSQDRPSRARYPSLTSHPTPPGLASGLDEATFQLTTTTRTSGMWTRCAERSASPTRSAEFWKLSSRAARRS